MPSQVIGLIEMDDAASGWQSLLTLASTRFDRPSVNYARRLGVDHAPPADFTQTESLEADSRQLRADLQLEFLRLVRSL